MSGGVNNTATTVGNIAEMLNSQAYAAVNNYAQTLPSITTINSQAYNFLGASNANITSTANALAFSTNSSVSNITGGIAQNNAGLENEGIQQYNAIAQTGKRKK